LDAGSIPAASPISILDFGFWIEERRLSPAFFILGESCLTRVLFQRKSVDLEWGGSYMLERRIGTIENTIQR